MVSQVRKSVDQSSFGRRPVWRRLRQADIPRGSAIVSTAASIDPKSIRSLQRESSNTPPASTHVGVIRRLIAEAHPSSKQRATA